MGEKGERDKNNERSGETTRGTGESKNNAVRNIMFDSPFPFSLTLVALSV